ncbi:MAG: dihydrolipoyl dehydrogenase [Betaproteobacteria bacterium]|nr:dihydrolipoyl dehydrogenase [Betaproteobacteria bacterium]
MSQQFDVLVIGAGPGGYIAAIRAAQLGFKVACIERWRNPKGDRVLGGTCLNVGCIPSKALLASSEHFESVQSHLDVHGISVKSASIDVSKMLGRKDQIVGKMTKGIEYLFKKNKITWLKGHGKFVGRQADRFAVDVFENGPEDGDAKDRVEASKVIIATGSKARHLAGIQVDQEYICDNEGALQFETVPKRLGIIGSGVIGLELGSVWRRLGAEVTILEALPDFLAAADQAVAKEAWKLFTKQGLSIQLGAKVDSVAIEGKGKAKQVVMHYSDPKGEAKTLEVDRLIVSVGRQPLTEAEIMAGQKPHIDYQCIPWVIYTSPEIAWVGRTEQELQKEGRAFKTGQFPFAANGRALGMDAADGFVKMICDKDTDEILGVHIVAAAASDLIAEAALAMEFKASAEDVARVCHPHPSLSEVMREAALAATENRALNL